MRPTLRIHPLAALSAPPLICPASGTRRYRHRPYLCPSSRHPSPLHGYLLPLLAQIILSILFVSTCPILFWVVGWMPLDWLRHSCLLSYTYAAYIGTLAIATAGFRASRYVAHGPRHYHRSNIRFMRLDRLHRLWIKSRTPPRWLHSGLGASIGYQASTVFVTGVIKGTIALSVVASFHTVHDIYSEVQGRVAPLPFNHSLYTLYNYNSGAVPLPTNAVLKDVGVIGGVTLHARLRVRAGTLDDQTSGDTRPRRKVKKSRALIESEESEAFFHVIEKSTAATLGSKTGPATAAAQEPADLPCIKPPRLFAQTVLQPLVNPFKARTVGPSKSGKQADFASSSKFAADLRSENPLYPIFAPSLSNGGDRSRQTGPPTGTPASRKQNRWPDTPHPHASRPQTSQALPPCRPTTEEDVFWSATSPNSTPFTYHLHSPRLADPSPVSGQNASTLAAVVPLDLKGKGKQREPVNIADSCESAGGWVDSGAEDGSSDYIPLSTPSPKRLGKRNASSPEPSSEGEASDPPVAKRARILSNEVEVLEDLDHIQTPRTPSNRKAKKTSRTRDIAAFFGDAFRVPGSTKVLRQCNLCRPMERVTDYVTTLRRHLEAHHKHEYRKWCKASNFTSQLPGFKKAAKLKQAESLIQSTLDDNLVPRSLIPEYSDQNFCDAAIEWLVATDQPLSALDNPKFHKMINIAAKAKSGVKIPSRKETRAEVVSKFAKHLIDMRRVLNSNRVPGRISITCDCWSAPNMDGYFAVTIHWIEEGAPGNWELKAGLAGFVSISESHTGQRLGQALFLILRRIGILRKIGWVTCDNASNNSTMLVELTRLLASQNPPIPFNASQRRIHCLAHIVHLATRAFLSQALPSRDAESAVSRIREIVIKARSSSGRKNLFKKIQQERLITMPKVLLLDTPTRWSSTFAMLKRATELREFVDEFVDALIREARRGKDSGTVNSIADLVLSQSDWEEIELLLSLLQLANDAQHQFSAERYPTLFSAVPAVESLQTAWERRAANAKYNPHHVGLQLGLAKLKTYYTRMDSSDAYIVCMVLDVPTKFSHFDEYWAPEDVSDAKERMQRVFREYYEAAVSRTRPESAHATPSHPTVKRQRRVQIDSDSEDGPPLVNADRSWEREYKAYVDGADDLGDLSVIEWWAASATRLPTWAAIARDYLAIMSSSVSSERAFSSAGLTVTDRRNRLKGDIMEALQVMKSVFKGSGDVMKDIGLTLEEELALFAQEEAEDDGDGPIGIELDE